MPRSRRGILVCCNPRLIEVASRCRRRRFAQLFMLDHIIPLALGGHPRSLDNLQIQPWPEAKRKDRIEVKLQCLVCSGQITLPDAQTLTARDWESAYNTYASVPCHRHRQLPASVVAYQGAPSHAM